MKNYVIVKDKLDLANLSNRFYQLKKKEKKKRKSCARVSRCRFSKKEISILETSIFKISE